MNPESRPAGDASPSSSGGRFARPASRDDSRLLVHAIAWARNGDSSALDFLYVRFADDVYGCVRSIVRDQHDADDIIQTLFATLPTTIQRYDQHGTPFAAWILSVARKPLSTISGCAGRGRSPRCGPAKTS